jgi:hypothetical protein
VVKLRSLKELCCLRVSVDIYIAAKGLLQCRRFQRFSHKRRHCRNHPGVILVVRLTMQETSVPHDSSLNAAAVEEMKQPTAGAV